MKRLVQLFSEYQHDKDQKEPWCLVDRYYETEHEIFEKYYVYDDSMFMKMCEIFNEDD